VGMDIGDTVGEFVVLQRCDADNHVLSEERFGESGERERDLEVLCDALSGTLHFCRWKTDDTDAAMHYISLSDARKELGKADPTQAGSALGRMLPQEEALTDLRIYLRSQWDGPSLR